MFSSFINRIKEATKDDAEKERERKEKANQDQKVEGKAASGDTASSSPTLGEGNEDPTVENVVDEVDHQSADLPVFVQPPSPPPASEPLSQEAAAPQVAPTKPLEVNGVVDGAQSDSKIDENEMDSSVAQTQEEGQPAPPPLAVTPADRYRHRLLDFFERYDPMKPLPPEAIDALVDPTTGIPEHMFFARLLKGYGLSASSSSTVAASALLPAAINKNTDGAPVDESTPAGPAKAGPFLAFPAVGRQSASPLGISVLSNSESHMAEASPTLARAVGIGAGPFDDEHSVDRGEGDSSRVRSGSMPPLPLHPSSATIPPQAADSKSPFHSTGNTATAETSPSKKAPIFVAHHRRRNSMAMANAETSVDIAAGSLSPNNFLLSTSAGEVVRQTSQGGLGDSSPISTLASPPGKILFSSPDGGSVRRGDSNLGGGGWAAAAQARRSSTSQPQQPWSSEWDALAAPFMPSTEFQPKSWNSNNKTATNPTSRLIPLDHRTALHGQRIIYHGVQMLVDHRNMLVGPDMRSLDTLNSLNPFTWIGVEGAVPMTEDRYQSASTLGLERTAGSLNQLQGLTRVPSSTKVANESDAASPLQLHQGSAAGRQEMLQIFIRRREALIDRAEQRMLRSSFLTPLDTAEGEAKDDDDSVGLEDASTVVSCLSELAVIDDVDLYKLHHIAPTDRLANGGDGCDAFEKLTSLALAQQEELAEKRAGIIATTRGGRGGPNSTVPNIKSSLYVGKGYVNIHWADDLLAGLDDSFASGSTAGRSVQSPVEIWEAAVGFSNLPEVPGRREAETPQRDLEACYDEATPAPVPAEPPVRELNDARHESTVPEVGVDAEVSPEAVKGVDADAVKKEGCTGDTLVSGDETPLQMEEDYPELDPNQI